MEIHINDHLEMINLKGPIRETRSSTGQVKLLII